MLTAARRLFRLGRRTNEQRYGSPESFLDRIRTGAVTIDELSARAGPYPTELLRGCESALLLFGAGFLGVNDAIHFAKAGIHDVTVVDTDGGRLEAMRRLYPSAWEFVTADAFAFVDAESAAASRYDVVSVDPFTGLMPRCRAYLPAFSVLARKAVVLGAECGLPVNPPRGWESRRTERSDLADWIVFVPSALQ